MKIYKLTDPALHRLGLIVRGADVKGQEKHSPESPGLRAIAQGFALCVSSDDERLTHEFPIYDALLEYVRTRCVSTDVAGRHPVPQIYGGFSDDSLDHMQGSSFRRLL